MTSRILTRALPLALALIVGASWWFAPPVAAISHPGARLGASGAGIGASISSVQAGFPFSGGATYRLNGPSTAYPGAVWVPVRVTLSNDQGANIADGRVVIADDPQGNGNTGANTGPAYATDFTADVQLPQGSRKAVTLYVRAADLGSQLTVSLQVGGKTVDSRAATTLQPQSGDTLAVGVLSDDTAVRPAFQALKLGDTTVAAAQFGEGTMPLDTQPQALDNFDLIVLSNYASDTLTGAQLDALRAWVHGGGALLVVGGAHAQKTMGHLPTDLLAATLNATTVVSSLPEAARLADAGGTGGGQIALSVATPQSGATVLLAHNGVPLIVDRSAGRGHLVYSALDPASNPLQGYSSQAQSLFWGRALASALQGPRDALVESGMQANTTSNFGQPGQNSFAAIAGDVGKATSRGLPALQVYVFLIVLYVLVLGPGNYLLLRWRRRLEWSWVTIPVVAVLFGAGSFGIAYARNGGDVLANVDSVVYLNPGARAMQTDSYIGLFAPFRGDYDLTASSAVPTLAWGLGNDTANSPSLGSSLSSGSPLGMRVDQGAAPLTAHLIGLQMWSQRNIGLHQSAPQQGAVTGRLVVSGKTVAGTVTNNTALTLRDCVIVGADGASAVLPRINPGETVRVSSFSLDSGLGGSPSATSGLNATSTGPLSGLYSGYNGAGKSGTLAGTDRYDSVLGAVFPGGSAATISAPLTLIGWSNTPIGLFSVNGASPRRTDLDLVVAPLGLRVASGLFTLAPGDLPVGVVGTTVSQINGSNGLTLNAGDRVDVQLALPATTRTRRVDTLSLVANPTNGSSSLVSSTARLWDWRTGQWRDVDLSNGSLDVKNAAPYVSADGHVLLRLEAPSGGSLSFNNVDQNIQIGASGSIQ